MPSAADAASTAPVDAEREEKLCQPESSLQAAAEVEAAGEQGEEVSVADMQVAKAAPPTETLVTSREAELKSEQTCEEEEKPECEPASGEEEEEDLGGEANDVEAEDSASFAAMLLPAADEGDQGPGGADADAEEGDPLPAADEVTEISVPAEEGEGEGGELEVADEASPERQDAPVPQDGGKAAEEAGQEPDPQDQEDEGGGERRLSVPLLLNPEDTGSEGVDKESDDQGAGTKRLSAVADLLNAGPAALDGETAGGCSEDAAAPAFDKAVC